VFVVQEIQPRVDELTRQWKELEETTAAKGEKLFDANRHVLYEQSCDDIDGWINEIESQIITDDVGHDLTTVNLLVQKQNVQTFASAMAVFVFLFLSYTVIDPQLYSLAIGNWSSFFYLLIPHSRVFSKIKVV